MNPNELIITITEQGCQVQGPISDKMRCYAMLELAKDAVRSFNDKAEKGNGTPLILPASPNLRIT